MRGTNLRDRIGIRVEPMLATLVSRPFERAGWVYEEKYDGERILAYKEGERVHLRTRNGKDRTSAFPKISSAIRSLKARTLLLDGEMVVFDPKGVSRFQLLQRGEGTVVYAVFDCLFREGEDLRSKPLAIRRAILENLIESSPSLMLSRRLAANGLDAFRIAKRRGYEGLVAKDSASPYVGGRSTKWLKVKVHQEDEFVIAGYTKPSGSRRYFGALLLGAFQKGKLRYVGKVGTGFSEKFLASLYERFRPLVRLRSPLSDPTREETATFLAPQLVAQVSFQEWTDDGKLRQPVFLGLREDKEPKDVLLPEVLG